jgi:sugar fermentation stimulation protein A
MKYQKVISATFLSRPNRFIAYVRVNGEIEVAHVKNTGRCRELLVEGCTVYLAVSDNPLRKTKYDLIAVEKVRAEKPPLMINMDSQIANDVAGEWLHACNLFSPNAVIRREVTHGASRFDFYIEDGDRRAFLEVKGVTLENDGVAMFPDAPTERGVKHVEELAACVREGFEAYVLFVVQMKDIRLVRPHDEMHRAFGDALRAAVRCGVHILAIDCIVSPEEIFPDLPVAVELGEKK